MSSRPRMGRDMSAQPSENSSAEPDSENRRRDVHVSIVTGDRLVYDGPADRVIVPSIEGQIAILPYHAPLLAAIEPGELRLVRGEREESFSVGGGFVEVLDNDVTVLADSAERPEEIDVARAEAARRRARILVRRYRGRPASAAAVQALRRSRARLKVARRLRTRSSRSA